MPCFDDVSCVVRTIGERTANACVSLLKSFFGQDNMAVVSRDPFSEALKSSLRAGLEMDRKWTLVIDADVLIHSPGLAAMLKDRHVLPENTFMYHASVMDKFFTRYRRAGNRLYRTAHLNRALALLPDGHPLRPERDLCQAMLEAGFCNYQSYQIIGLHDHCQNYRDILRKMVLFVAKHDTLLEWLTEIWEKGQDDLDFQAALDGIRNANISGTLEVGPTLLDRLPKAIVAKWSAMEKPPLDVSDIDSDWVGRLIESELDSAGIKATDDTAPREYASCVA